MANFRVAAGCLGLGLWVSIAIWSIVADCACSSVAMVLVFVGGSRRQG